MRRIKKIAAVLILVLVAYLAIGYFLHLVVFPEPRPDISHYFQPGDVFYSKAEGIKQTVIKQEDGKVYCKVEMEPHADGPPLHIHSGFDELFEAPDKPISFIVDSRKITLQPGEKYFVPRGTPHKPFNETDARVTLVMKESAFPEELAVYLNQVYGYVDESEENLRPPGVIFQMAMFHQHFDSYLGEGPPLGVQKTMDFLVIPLARVLGYKSYYEKYAISR